MQPKLKKRDNNFSVAFFDMKTKENKNYTGVILSKNYKTKDNEWKSEELHIFPEDLLKIASLCQRAYSEYKDSLENKNTVPTKTEVESLADDLDDAVPFN